MNKTKTNPILYCPSGHKTYLFIFEIFDDSITDPDRDDHIMSGRRRYCKECSDKNNAEFIYLNEQCTEGQKNDI